MKAETIKTWDIRDIERMDSRNGGHFFDAGAMRFFKSRTSEAGIELDDKIYFVTSERFDSSTPRYYSVRYYDQSANNTDRCKIETLGEFQQYATSKQAWSAIYKITGNPWK